LADAGAISIQGVTSSQEGGLIAEMEHYFRKSLRLTEKVTGVKFVTTEHSLFKLSIVNFYTSKLRYKFFTSGSLGVSWSFF